MRQVSPVLAPPGRNKPSLISLNNSGAGRISAITIALHPLLAPFEPTQSDPFDTVKAAHLLNRAGFGGTPEEVAQIVKLGPTRAADALLDFPAAPAEKQNAKNVPDLSAIAEYPSSFREFRQMVMGKSQQDRMMLVQKFMRANREALMATAS